MKRSGFTLAETMITLFLIALIFGVVAALIQNGYRVLSFQSKKERSTLAAQVALDRLCSELREATAVDSTGPTLEFRKVDKSVTGRFDTASPPTDYPFGSLITVRYSTDGQGFLLRQAGGQSAVLAEGVSGFNCTLTGARMEIALGVQEQTLLRSLSTVVLLPGLQ